MCSTKVYTLVNWKRFKLISLNKNIFIAKPDKGSGVVIFNYTDYTAKMELILNAWD